MTLTKLKIGEKNARKVSLSLYDDGWRIEK
jgi:hypothetical protein